jgi:hypothetical protein
MSPRSTRATSRVDSVHPESNRSACARLNGAVGKGIPLAGVSLGFLKTLNLPIPTAPKILMPLTSLGA